MTSRSLTQKGSAHVAIVITLVIVVLGALGFVFWKNFIDKKPIAKNDENSKTTDSKTTDTKSQPIDEYAGWKTYTSTRDGYSIKYPSDWIAIDETNNDGPYIRNFDPSSRPAEDRTQNKNYPKDYMYLRVSKIEANDANLLGATASEWYAKLGVSRTSGAGVGYTFDPSTVSDITINGMAAKKSKTVFTETNEDIFLLHDESVYRIMLYPYDSSSNSIV